MLEKVLLKNVGVRYIDRIDVYMAQGGYQAARKALLEYEPQEIIDIVKESGLRGRGGAGFPTGLKWDFMPKDPSLAKYLCINFHEGETGTFKDRYLVEEDPHQVLEGVIIAAYAVGARKAYIHTRTEFPLGIKRWIKAVAEAHGRGFLGKNILGTDFSLDMHVHRGAGAYITGEETALMESLEGKRGEPRLKPPYPTQAGLYGQPTLINNVETLANVPHIINHGADWFKSIGTLRSPGPKLFCVSGHVRWPGNYELPLGTPLRQIIYGHAGGMRGERPLKAVIPGGASTPVLTPEHLDIPMDFESLLEVGSALGTGAVVVMEEGTDMVDVAQRLIRFFQYESCGKCTPCRVGTTQLLHTLDRILAGQGQEEDIDLLESTCGEMIGRTFCPLGEAAVNPVLSTLKHFRHEYEQRVRHEQPVLVA